MQFVYCDGGRSKYFKATNVGDCVTRAIANATGIDYKEVYDRLFYLTKTRRYSKREKHYSHESPRDGVFTRVAKKYLEQELGWIWVACMSIGTGCQVHLTEDELPKEGNYILNLSRHFSCIKDGVLYDTYDCSRGGSRCVYGYWRQPTEEEYKAFKDNQESIQTYKDFMAKQKLDKKSKIEEIKKKHKPTITKLEKKIKELQHQLVLEQNRQKREIAKLEESFKDSWAYHSIDNNA